MTIKIGVCGYGPMGRMHSQILNRLEGAQIVGVADVQEPLRARAAEELGVPTYASAESLIDERVADALFICTPTYLHAPLAIRGLEQQQHVFSEKPMGLNADECTAMIDAAARNKRLLTVGQVLRFWPEYVFLKQTIDTGRLGRLLTLSMLRIGGVSRGWRNWFLDERLGGTQIFDRHIHDTDLCIWLFGKPTSVRTYGSTGQIGGLNHTFTRYRYPGTTVTAEGSADLPPGFPFTMSYLAVFEQGAIEYSNRTTPSITLYSSSGKPETPELPNPIGTIATGLNIASAGGYYLEDMYFLDCIANGRVPEIVTPESARDTVAVVRLEIESARKEAEIDVPSA